MEEINDKLLQFFTANYKPGIIGIWGAKDAVGLAIREAEKPLTAQMRELLSGPIASSLET